MLVYIIGALIAYLIGSFSTSLVIAKFKKKELRSSGSGNLGASNTTILLGFKWGVVVGLVDILKCAIPVFLTRRFFFTDHYYLPFIVAACCILGHIFPFYLKFKGGKGFACLVGAILGYSCSTNFLLIVIYAVAIIGITFITNYIAIATATCCITFPIAIGILDKAAAPAPYGSIIAAIILLIPCIVIVSLHIPNYKRIIKGEEIGIKDALSKKHRI